MNLVNLGRWEPAELLALARFTAGRLEQQEREDLRSLAPQLRGALESLDAARRVCRADQARARDAAEVGEGARDSLLQVVRALAQDLRETSPARFQALFPEGNLAFLLAEDAAVASRAQALADGMRAQQDAALASRAGVLAEKTAAFLVGVKAAAARAVEWSQAQEQERIARDRLQAVLRALSNVLRDLLPGEAAVAYFPTRDELQQS